MYGIELNKGVSVVRVFENGGKKKVKYIRGSDIGEATVRTVHINEKPVEYFLCHGLRIFLDDLYMKGGRIATCGAFTKATSA